MTNYDKIVFHMERNDPNGEYTVEGIKQYPFVYLDILQAWYYDLKEANEKIPVWLTFAIKWLDAVTI